MPSSPPVPPAPAKLPTKLPVGTAPARYWALLPCAGSGSRASASHTHSANSTRARPELPKQYQTIAGQPLVLHTLAAFAAVPRLAAVWLVVAPGERFFAQHPNPLLRAVDCGGSSRAQSVLHGLAHLQTQGAASGDWVLVHDAARCLVTPAQINALIDACCADAVGGLLALPLADTLKQAHSGRVCATLARGDKWLAQTPQMFRLGLLRQALLAAAQAGLQASDEASAIEALGHAPLLVAGSAQNFKVTYPDDFALAEAVLRHRAQHKNG